MNFLSISASQEAASISYFRKGVDVINIEAGREVQPSHWYADAVDFINKYYKNFLGGLDYIAVDIGPGSYTGIKVAGAFAKGLAAGLELPLTPVNSMEGQAFFAPSDKLCVLVRDARRGLYYFAAYRKEENTMNCIIEPCVKPLEEISGSILKLKNEDLFLMGEKINLKISGIAGFYNPPISSKGIGHVSKMCYAAKKFINERELQPLYLRLSDAEINLKKGH